MATAQDVIAKAASQLGVSENPIGSNRGTPYHAWFGAESQGWQWCSIFVTWVFHHVDPALVHGLKAAYSGDFLLTGRKYGEEIPAPQPGCIAIMDYNADNFTDHIGIVESVTPGSMVLIEGNHNNRVERVNRGAGGSTRYWFIMPKYSSVQPPKPREAEMQTWEYFDTTEVVKIDCYRARADYYVTTDGATKNLVFTFQGKDGGEPISADGQEIKTDIQHDHNLQDILKQSRFKELKGSYKLTVTCSHPIDISIREVPK
jgi:hypothetical protein